MKKFPSILFVFSLLFMLTACSSSADPSQESSGQTTSPSSQQDSVSVSNAVLESESTESEQSANNTLIVYFSRWGNTEYPSDVDAITSASIVVDNNSRYGTTEYVANMIAENVGGDLHRIETVTPYTADFDELRDVNHDEMSRNYLPELKEMISFRQAQVVRIVVHILGEFWIASRIIGPAQIFLAVGSQQIAFHRVPDG